MNMQATSSNIATTASGASGAGGESMAAPLRACSTSGCRVSKYVEVTKRKCSQFVSAPYIMPKPLVVNGKTSIFQVGGEMAKMGDIPSLSAASGAGDGQPIYRIKPGTHAHVINYVFIDEGSDSMEKAKSEDQEAMRMLLDSQRESATAKLQKLISTHRAIAQTSAAAAQATVPTTPALAASATVSTPNTAVAAPVANSVNVTTPQIHPDLSIASVEGALPFVANRTSAPGATAQPKPTAVDNSVDQLQAEILKLRRTVARLGGGHATK
ncbi:uncharacterized protein Boh2 [Drosophila virilis]|uniref:Uncharacterized protein n=1 Tax=Drosophila virilis TaxID=7244 RepID=B4LQG4_DROVI|nr:uncharacterized protein LOC6629209 [Drosophila virilis]EDW63414.2 uncharacterized protein Dvir_GJ13234 [Drosophila virilis]